MRAGPLLLLFLLFPAWVHSEEASPRLLDGPWQFFPGALLAPQDPRWDSPEVRMVRVPSSWNAEVWPGKPKGVPEGVGTYRLVLDRADGKEWALDWTLAGSAAVVFVDGRTVARVGTPGTSVAEEVPANRPQLITLGTGPRTEIVVQVTNHHHVDGGLWAPLTAGGATLLEARARSDRAWELLLAGACLILGLITGLAAVRPGTLRPVLWFGGLSLFLGLRILVHGHLSVYWLVPDLPWEWFHKIRHGTMYGGSAVALLLIHSFFPGGIRRWFLRTSMAVALILGGAVLFLPYRWYGDLLYPYTVVVALQIGVAVQTLWRNRGKAEGYQLPVILGMAVLLAGSTVEFIRVTFFLPLPETLPVATLLLVICMGTGVALQQLGLYRRIQSINDTKDTMLSIIAHDLKAPLLGAARYVKKHLLPETIRLEDKREALSVLSSTLERSGALLEALLSWSLSQSGRLALDPRPHSARALVLEAAASLERGWATKGIVFEVDGGDFPVRVDRETILVVLRNLLSNAQKFTPSGGRVTVAVEKARRGVAIRVSDTGAGMDSPQLDRVLSHREKLVTPGTDGETGSGFGLFLCQEFLRRNGGHLEASSRPGEGSTFVAHLPAG